MKRPLYLMMIITAVLIFAILITLVLLQKKGTKPTVPQIPLAVKSQLNFPVLFPVNDQTDGYWIQPGTIKYVNQDGQNYFTYILENSTNQITFSEQAYPDILIFDKLVGSMRQYDEVQTLPGKVELTRPADLNGGQAGVYSNSDILLFAKPVHDLSNSDWTKVFNGLASTR